MASLFRPHAAPLRPQGPPTSYSSSLQPVANDSNGRTISRRVSRTDLDFEQALRGEGTVLLREGIDMNSLGVESPSPMNRSFSAYSTPSTTPANRAISRVSLQPATPNVVPPSPSPAPASSSLSNGANGVRLGNTVGTSSTSGPSPSASSQDLVADAAEEAERQTNRRSMYRSPGTASSPDLATLLRKAKERGGAISSAVAGQSRGKRRDEPVPPLPDQTIRGNAPSSFSGDRFGVERNGVGSPKNSKNEGTIKAPKSSVRAKTSALWGKMLGTNTGRERSKTDASLHPLMDAFTPPVPAIPAEHRTPIRSPIADVFSTSSATDSSSKPLPPIVHSPVSYTRDGEDIDERSIVFVDKVAPLPPLPPPSQPSTPVRSPPLNTSKRRSMSVTDAEIKHVLSLSSPTLPVAPSSPSPLVPKTPDNRRIDSAPAQLEDKGGPSNGTLDIFKGELFTLDSHFGPSLDLKDPSTPSRHRKATADSLVSFSPRDTQGDRTDSNKPSFSDPFGGRPIEDDDNATPSAIIPPRTSSLSLRSSSARNSLGSTHGPGVRMSTPPRSRSGPPTGLMAPGQSPRNASQLRVLHRSTASSSEPSLIPIQDGTRLFSTIRTGSQQELASPDSAQSPTIVTGDDSADLETRGKEMASRCWNENEDFLAKEKIAEWLGGHGQINKVALRHYVDNFDFAGLRLDLAFRRLCGKLYLKAETQQVDRILEQFSRRYWECNPETVYGSANIVHAVSYSLLLLNTDLHVAELSTRMSRSQFVRNTMSAIQVQLSPELASAYATDVVNDEASSIHRTGSEEMENMTRSKRSDSIASWNSISKEAITSHPTAPASAQSLGSSMANGSTPSVQIVNGDQPNRPQHGRAWEMDMESLLKEMYTAVKSQQILQPIGSNMTRSSMSSLSPGGGMMRNRSLRSQPDRLTTLKRGSIRGLQSVLGVQSGVSPYSSNSSIDGRVSPSPSFATSTHEVYGSSSSFFNPTLGFASNLSHTIIKEAQEDDDRSVHSEDSNSTTISISDEELALLGAPWAKEGMLCRKQYWESAGKRAKDKGWMDVFVVIQKGELNMFVFGDHTAGATGMFGGGNWLANANPVGTIHLAHSLAHALPPPGYHRRPHCMVLTLANRGVYFFQAGTEELVNEWVSTCNYWAARTSKEPLAGGVSNMEYGWNRVADVYGHGRSQSQTELWRDDAPDTVSVRSGKSTRSKYGWKEGAATVRAYSPRSDKTFINEWKPPLPPTVASNHDEESQLDALRKHVASLKKDLEVHNELREPMTALYLHRSANAMKAQSNWEEKSQYLLREIVKYDLYIDSLQAAMTLRLKKRGEKALERALSSSTDEATNGSTKWKGPDSATINEEPEPITPNSRNFPQNSHRRETAEFDKDDDDDDDEDDDNLN